MNEKLVKLLEEAEKTIGLLMLEVNRLNDEIELLYKLVKEQDKKIIDLAFDLAYANRTDEFRKELEKPVGLNWWKGDPTCGGIAENYMSKETSDKC